MYFPLLLRCLLRKEKRREDCVHGCANMLVKESFTAFTINRELSWGSWFITLSSYVRCDINFDLLWQTSACFIIRVHEFQFLSGYYVRKTLTVTIPKILRNQMLRQSATYRTKYHVRQFVHKTIRIDLEAYFYFGNAERFARNGTLWELNDTFWERNETIWGRNETFWERNALSDRWTERFERFVRFSLVFSFPRNSDYLADRPFLFILATTIWK